MVERLVYISPRLPSVTFESTTRINVHRASHNAEAKKKGISKFPILLWSFWIA